MRQIVFIGTTHRQAVKWRNAVIDQVQEMQPEGLPDYKTAAVNWTDKPDIVGRMDGRSTAVMMHPEVGDSELTRVARGRLRVLGGVDDALAFLTGQA